MIGYLTGSSSSVRFSVYTYGEMVWVNPFSGSKYIQWIPTTITGYCYYRSGTAGLYSKDLSSFTGYGTIDSSITQYWFSSCTWTDIITNFSNTTMYNNGMFQNCLSLLTAQLPECTYIGERTFFGCSNLKEVSIPVCTEVAKDAFAGCSSLSKIVLPVCSYLGAHAFQACRSLSEITLGYSVEPVVLDYEYYPSNRSEVFVLTGITSSTGSIYVPSSLVSRYKTATGWDYFSNRIFPIQ